MGAGAGAVVEVMIWSRYPGLGFLRSAVAQPRCIRACPVTLSMGAPVCRAGCPRGPGRGDYSEPGGTDSGVSPRGLSFTDGSAVRRSTKLLPLLRGAGRQLHQRRTCNKPILGPGRWGEHRLFALQPRQLYADGGFWYMSSET